VKRSNSGNHDPGRGRQVSLWLAAGLLFAFLVSCSDQGPSDTATLSGRTDNSSAAVDVRQSGLEKPTVEFAYFSTGLLSAEALAAEQWGYFAEAGFSAVTARAMNSSTTAIALLRAGEYDFAYASYAVAFQAIDQRIADLRLVTGLQAVGPGQQVVLARTDRGITTLAGLAGKKIGGSQIGGVNEIQFGEALATVGLSLDDVRFVEVPTPSFILALERGDIDAGFTFGAIRAEIEQNPRPDIAVLFDFTEVPVLDAMPLGAIWTTRAFFESNPRTVAAFREAVQRAGAELAADMDLYVQLASKLAGQDTETFRRAGRPIWQPDPTQEQLQNLANLMLKYGQIDGAIDVARVASVKPLE
jgi:ABC-type nitrate/sulfonate/bicarbonate transport system substrate-binding protein